MASLTRRRSGHTERTADVAFAIRAKQLRGESHPSR